MTYQKVKDTVVSEKEFTTAKKFGWLTFRLLLFFVSLGVALAMVASATLGILPAVGVLGVSIYMFLLCLEICSDNEKSFKRVRAVSNLWFLPVIGAVVVVFVLNMFNFV